MSKSCDICIPLREQHRHVHTKPLCQYYCPSTKLGDKAIRGLFRRRDGENRTLGHHNGTEVHFICNTCNTPITGQKGGYSETANGAHITSAIQRHIIDSNHCPSSIRTFLKTDGGIERFKEYAQEKGLEISSSNSNEIITQLKNYSIYATGDGTQDADPADIMAHNVITGFHIWNEQHHGVKTVIVYNEIRRPISGTQTRDMGQFHQQLIDFFGKCISCTENLNLDHEVKRCARCDWFICNKPQCKKVLADVDRVKIDRRLRFYISPKSGKYKAGPRNRGLMGKWFEVCTKCHQGISNTPNGQLYGGKRKKQSPAKRKSLAKKKSHAKKKTTVKVVAGKKRVIHTGSKGGKYYISSQRKVYI